MSSQPKRKSIASAIADAATQAEEVARMRCDDEGDADIDQVLIDHEHAKRQKTKETEPEEQKASDTACLMAVVDERLLVVGSGVSASAAPTNAEERRVALARLQALVAADEAADDDLDMGPKLPTTKEFMKTYIADTKKKAAAMSRGEEVTDCVYPDQAAFLWSLDQDQLIHWMHFLEVGKTLSVWKSAKTVANYANIEPRSGKQRFGGRAVDFPHKLVVLGPTLKAQFAAMGPEGNFAKLGKENGPETVEKLKFEMVLSGEKYSKRVCNDAFGNPLADAFFDWLEALVEWAVREHFKAGKYNVFKAFVEKKVNEANKKKTTDAAKKKQEVGADDLEKAPQTDEAWLELLLSNHMAPVVKTDAKGTRNISVSVPAFDKLRKDKNNNILGLDADYVPRDTPNKIFRTMFYERKALVNGEDQQRKEHVITYWRCMTAGEVQKGGDVSKAFPFAPLDMHARNGDLFMPLVSLNFYDWSGKDQTGVTKGIWDLVYVGHDGELNDTHCRGCNPLEAIPMATSYIPAPQRDYDGDAPSAASAALIHAAVGEVDPREFLC